ncbi:hypothetical protein [Mycoplasma phocoeninasale]|uniref:Uncharacterized protein n=1 Tax=Mycoplasma phocoeninasale TaxID=2726117 RepID=A0A858U466_9MOLU|nr:hypothetical protein [Mycoplasma phocoeninasale]MBN0970704.1 hypothetical protein [Mycoplasma phocoeninasale]QJG66187.1 hypothetical protein HGG64_00410 [Mycoplasma phocoeninasale]
MENFKTMDDTKSKTISGGFAITTLITTILSVIPAVIGGIGAAAGIAKSLSSAKGEIKTKDGFSVKWDDANTNVGFSVGFHYCI